MLDLRVSSPTTEALSANRKGPDQHVLVAGAGFEPATFGL